MLIEEDGPLDVFINFRTWIWSDQLPQEATPPGRQLLKGVFQCIYCMSIWVGTVLAVLPTKVSIPFALSAVAVALDRVHMRTGFNAKSS